MAFTALFPPHCEYIIAFLRHKSFKTYLQKIHFILYSLHSSLRKQDPEEMQIKVCLRFAEIFSDAEQSLLNLLERNFLKTKVIRVRKDDYILIFKI